MVGLGLIDDKNDMKNRKAYMLYVARQVLTGNLSVEEAMKKSHVKDKRTIVNWLRRAIREGQSERISGLTLDKQRYHEEHDLHSSEGKIQNLASELKRYKQGYQEKHDVYSPEEKIQNLESELEGFKRRNLELVRFQNILTNKINDLEVLIHYAERIYQIDIMKIRKRKSK